MRKIAPVKPVKIGTMNVNTVASDSDKYCKEKYIPEIPKNLDPRGAFARYRTQYYEKDSHPLRPRNISKVRTPLGPSNGSGTFCQYLTRISDSL